MKIYKKITKSLLAALALPALAACNGYLDEVPKSDITTIETTFEKREDAEQWLMTCMSFRDNALSHVYINPAFGDQTRSWPMNTPIPKDWEKKKTIFRA